MGFMSWYRKLTGCGIAPADLKVTQAAAEGGDAEAQFALGLQYSFPGGRGEDLNRAAGWYQKAAHQEHALAQFNLAMMFASGQGVTKDDVAALKWTRRAAEGGDAGAQFNLASRCHRASMEQAAPDSGESRIEAFKWFDLAAGQGYRGADSARERLMLGMTHTEVADGNHRVARFVARNPAPAPVDPSVPLPQ